MTHLENACRSGLVYLGGGGGSLLMQTIAVVMPTFEEHHLVLATKSASSIKLS